MGKPTTDQTTQYASNGHVDLRDVVDILLAYDPETFMEQLVSLLTSQDERYPTQEGPRVLYRPGILGRVASIRQDDEELYNGVFVPAITRDRRYDLRRIETHLDQLTPKRSGSFPQPQTATTLLGKTFDPLRCFVQEILAEGFTILAGKPKKGKSYLALDMSLSIAVGRQAFMKFATEKAKVLYVSLEDGERRLQRRLRQIQHNIATPQGLDFLYTFPRLGEGALEAIEHYAKIYKVIIIDTLGRILPTQTPARKSLSEYQEFTDNLGPIQLLAQQLRIAVVVIDHVRKASVEDDGDAILGSQGKFGVADHALIYGRKGEEKDGVVKIISRDLEEEKIVLTMVDGHLEFIGKGELYELDSEQNRIIKILEEEARPMAIPDIMRALGISGDQHYKRFRVVMHRLYETDRVGRTKRGLYRLYGDDRADDVPF